MDIVSAEKIVSAFKLELITQDLAIDENKLPYSKNQIMTAIKVLIISYIQLNQLTVQKAEYLVSSISGLKRFVPFEKAFIINQAHEKAQQNFELTYEEDYLYSTFVHDVLDSEEVAKSEEELRSLMRSLSPENRLDSNYLETAYKKIGIPYKVEYQKILRRYAKEQDRYKSPRKITVSMGIGMLILFIMANQYLFHKVIDRFYILALLSIVVYNAITHFFLTDEGPTKKKKVLAGALALLVMGSDHVISNYGSTEIGSFFQRSDEYEVQYYVNLFPGNDAKNYRVKADIAASFSDETYTDDEGNTQGSVKRVYYINQAYMPNGGTIRFDEDLVDSERPELTIGKKVELKDSTNRKWYVELTNEQVK